MRVAAMVYEAVLLFGVVFVTSLAVLGTLNWSYPLPDGRRWVLQALLFVVIGFYFVWCWSRSGQTLALKTWRLQLVGPDARAPSLPRSLARYVLAWHMFIPGILAVAGVVMLGSFALMMTPALLDPGRRLLHDRWTSTQLIRSA